ncbi:TOBE domain-containing protein, partial [Pigmentiphaga soli]|uniref:TOBE domain-containing protein n=1 Tax=Pigmentiphaga soli TaxID=1007095 RepID=UPI0031E8AB97
AGAPRPAAGGDVTLAVRPEHLALRPADATPDARNALRGRVADRSFVGNAVNLLVDLGGGCRVTVECRGEAARQPGDPVQVCWDPAQAIAFEPETGDAAVAA